MNDEVKKEVFATLCPNSGAYTIHPELSKICMEKITNSIKAVPEAADRTWPVNASDLDCDVLEIRVDPTWRQYQVVVTRIGNDNPEKRFISDLGLFTNVPAATLVVELNRTLKYRD